MPWSFTLCQLDMMLAEAKWRFHYTHTHNQYVWCSRSCTIAEAFWLRSWPCQSNHQIHSRNHGFVGMESRLCLLSLARCLSSQSFHRKTAELSCRQSSRPMKATRREIHTRPAPKHICTMSRCLDCLILTLDLPFFQVPSWLPNFLVPCNGYWLSNVLIELEIVQCSSWDHDLDALKDCLP